MIIECLTDSTRVIAPVAGIFIDLQNFRYLLIGEYLLECLLLAHLKAAIKVRSHQALPKVLNQTLFDLPRFILLFVEGARLKIFLLLVGSFLYYAHVRNDIAEVG